MKKLLTLSLMVISLNSLAASSDEKLKNCLQRTITASSMELNRSDKPNDVLKSMNKGIKACKDEVKLMVKAEKDAKNKKSLLDKLAKLQEKLKSLN